MQTKPDVPPLDSQPVKNAARATLGGESAEVEALLARAPAHVSEAYRKARKELHAAAGMLAAIASAKSEQEAIDYARALRGRLAPMGVEWVRARRALAQSGGAVIDPAGKCGRCLGTLATCACGT